MTPKSKKVEGWGMNGTTMGPVCGIERRKIPQRDPGQSPGEKLFYCVNYKRVRTPLVATFVEN